MPDQSKVACVFGGTGFLGTQVVRELAKAGFRVKVVTRVPERAYDLKPCGSVGQIVPFACHHCDEDSLRTAVAGCDMVVNLVWLDALDHPVVVELFTSTDCPGCSVADSVLFKIRDHPKIIALGCHVDYFGPVAGNKDPGNQECTNRQWYYDTYRWDGEADLVTPQFITNGELKFRALYAYEIFKKIQITYEKRLAPKWIKFEQLDDDTLRLHLPDDDHILFHRGESHGVWLIRYLDSDVLKIPPADENGTPKVIRYTNIVKKMRHVGRWYGEPRTVDVDLRYFDDEIRLKQGGWAAIIQYLNGARIVAAGKLPDKPVDPRKEAAVRKALEDEIKNANLKDLED
jgi:hypothetical protein